MVSFKLQYAERNGAHCHVINLQSPERGQDCGVQSASSLHEAPTAPSQFNFLP